MPTTKTFRVFVSSTFSDLVAERNALQEEVFPKLQELCQEHGCRFQAIDLRWGVSEEASLDQRAISICRKEVKRCLEVTPRPNFIVLLGDRYGWQPLPEEIPTGEFEEILEAVANNKDKDLLRRWYRKDENAVPPSYILQPRTTEEDKDPATWVNTERELRIILVEATRRMGKEDKDRSKYLASATHLEIIDGLNPPEELSDPKDPGQHVFCFFRSIQGLPQDISAKDFIDLDEQGKLDQGARDRLEGLKAEIKDKLPKENVHNDYQASWNGNGITTDHLDKLCEDVYESLKGVIEEEIAQLKQKNEQQAEIEEHEEFGKQRTKVFEGRQDILKDIADYLDDGNGAPMAVWGKSGSGKSALMAKAIEQAEKNHPQAKRVYRYIGITAGSTDGRSLLSSLCRQISECYGKVEAEVPEAYQDLIQKFPALLASATAKKPLILFLDALDQLSPADHARNLAWLPAELPPNVRLVVSTLPGDKEAYGECKRALDLKLPPENILELKPLPLADGSTVLDNWLKAAKPKRTLQGPQRQAVLDSFAHKGNPLYLKLAFEEARGWRSYDPVPKLDTDVSGIIRQMFDRLSSPSAHGPVLVGKSLAYLAAARNGLTEEEMLDLLSRDDEVMEDLRARSVKSPETDTLPVVLWSRLYFDLDPYLSERGADGTSLMSFYHRQLREAAEAEYLAGQAKTEAHRHLAAYFGEQPTYWVEERETPNLRKLSELPYQQTEGLQARELKGTLTDIEFVESKCLAGMIYDFIEDYHRVLRDPSIEEAFCVEPEGYKMLEDIKQYASFIRAQANILTQSPRLAFQQAANEPDNTSPAESAADDLAYRPWLKWIDKPQSISPRLITIEVNSFTGRPELSNDGNRVISDQLSTFKIWNCISGEEIASKEGVFYGKLPTEDIAVILLSGKPALFDINRECYIAKSEKPASKLWVSPNGKIIAAYSIDGCRVDIYEISEIERPLGSIELPRRHIFALASSSDGKKLVINENPLYRNDLHLYEAESSKGISFRAREINGGQIAIQKHSNEVIYIGKDGRARVINPDSGEEYDITRKGTQYDKSFLEICDDNELIALMVINRRSMHVQCLRRRKIIREIDISRVSVTCSCFSFDGTSLIVGLKDGRVIISSIFSDEDNFIKVCEEEVSCCKSIFLRGEELLIVGTNKGKLYQVDLKQGHLKDMLAMSIEPICCCAPSPGNDSVLVGTSNGRVYMVKLGDGRVQFIGESSLGCIDRLVFIEDKPVNLLVFHRNRTIEILDLPNECFFEFPHNYCTELRHAAFTDDGDLFAASYDDGSIVIVDIEQSKCINRIFPDKDVDSGFRTINKLSFYPNSQVLISYGTRRGVKCWNPRNGEREKSLLEANRLVGTLSFSPNGRYVAVGSGNDCDIQIKETASRVKLGTVKSQGKVITSIAFNRDGQLMISGSKEVDKDTGFIEVWSVDNMIKSSPLSEVEEKNEVVYSIASSTNRKLVAYVTNLGKIHIIEDDNMSILNNFSYSKKCIRTCAISPNSRYLATGGTDEYFQVWDISKGKAVFKRRLLDTRKEQAYSCRFTPDGKQILVGWLSGLAELWDIKRGVLIGSVLGEAAVRACDISPDGNFILLGYGRGEIKILSLEGFEEVNSIGPARQLNSCSFSPDGDWVVNGHNNGVLRIWNVKNGEIRKKEQAHDSHIYSCSWSSDGKYIATCSEDGWLKIWRLETMKPIGSFLAQHAIRSICWSYDGSKIFFGDRSLHCLRFMI